MSDIYICSTRQNNNLIYKNDPVQKFTWILILCVVYWMIHDWFSVLWYLFTSPLLVLSSSLHMLWFLNIFCIFESFSTVTLWFWDPSFHTEDHGWTRTQLLQKVETFTDAQYNTLRAGGVDNRDNLGNNTDYKKTFECGHFLFCLVKYENICYVK